jgi:hypothetical protein
MKIIEQNSFGQKRLTLLVILKRKKNKTTFSLLLSNFSPFSLNPLAATPIPKIQTSSITM